MKNSKKELAMVLKGIKTVRARWLRCARSKAREIQELFPLLTPAQAFHQSLVHSEVFKEYEKLMNLYGILGADVDQYLEALEPAGKVVPIGKRAA